MLTQRCNSYYLREEDGLYTSSSLIPLIYSGLLEQSPWQQLLVTLREVMASDVAAITLRTGSQHLSPMIIWDREQPLTQNQISQAQADHARLLGDDPLNQLLRQSGDIFILEEVIERDALEASDFYQCLMKPYGIEHQIGMCFAEPSGWVCTIGLMRGGERSAFNSTDKEILLELLPHLEKSLAVLARLKHSEVECSVFEQALDKLGLGVILLDRHAEVVDCNEVAKNMLRKHESLTILNNRLFSQRDKEALDKSIQEAIAASDSHPAIPYIQPVRLSAGFEELGLLIRSIDTALYQSDKSPKVIVYLSNPMRDNVLSTQLIRCLFGLTDTEAHVVMLLCNGFTLSEVALKLDVAENTARVYSKRIFAKLGVGRQVELVRMVLGSVALLA
ncbi:helix-turn-helix transcriptional regulator [Oceanicoccus sp. KOV_DT_Chl]|uniref:helix-turn-helix transcriptional regulator n=1 Tax=Oceanicoccus sp. KOV_DT_Chl TaxID=1904639 RepID=UPI000C7DF3A4|nr:helix-turn-helix transcriptional regulator [Oceanicoccus sp. KOV_DT_Chl]